MDTARERYEKIIKLMNLKDSEVARGAHVPPATLSDWKNGKYIPKADKMEKIAKFLNVSVDYLLTGNEKEPAEADPFMLKMMEIAKNATPDQKKMILGLADTVLREK